jgi:DNA primase
MAKIKEEDVDALRDGVDVIELVSSYTQLKKAGGSNYKGLCPFHSEKTPSFTVDSSKGLWHCWGCSAGGNIYHFVQKIENLAFPDAVEWLAKKTGFTLHYEEMRPGEERAAGIKMRIVAANSAATSFYHDALFSSPEANAARVYLEGRGFGKETATKWRLGYASETWDLLSKHLLSKGFTSDELEAAGLSRRRQGDGSLYDVFRNRIIFPTWNHQGDIVGFGARALAPDQQPKYLNTAETKAFSKSRVMYGLDKAKGSIARGETALVVEGYTDVIALHEAGIEDAVATNGVALGESHFELLKRWAKRVVLMLDSDQAGQGATERSFGFQHRLGIEVLVAPLPEGRDPAEVVAADGPDAIRSALSDARPLLEFKLDQTIAKLPADTPEAKSRAVREAVKVLGWHPDPIARHEYAFIVARKIGVDAGAVQRALSEGTVGLHEAETEGAPDRRFPGYIKVEREALQLLLTRTRETGARALELEEKSFSSAPRKELFRCALRAFEDGKNFVGADVAEALSPEALALFTELAVGAEVDVVEDPSARADELFTRLQIFALDREIRTRRTSLQDVNPLDQPERHDELFTELVALEARKRDLQRSLQVTA